MKFRLIIRSLFALGICLLCFCNSVFAQPANDACASPTTIVPTASCSYTTYNIKNATNAAPTGACGGATATTTYDVWFRFQAVSGTVAITLNNFGNNLTAATTYIQVLSGTCGSLTSLGCQSASSRLVVSGLTTGTFYYIRIYVTANPNGSGAANRYDYDMCVQQSTNDDCSGAISLTPNATCSNVTGSLDLASTSTGIPSGCGPAGTHYDVWYQFTAAQTYQLIALSSLGANITNPAIEVYSGTCGSLTSLACGSTSVSVSGLTIGATYFVRVSQVGSNPSGTGTAANFSICVYHPTAATYDYGKSYVNITRNSGGGTINPGDTLEIRATLVIRSQSLDSLSFLDTIRTGGGVRYVPGSIALRTNEGKVYKSFTDGFDSDAGYYYVSGTDTVIRINMGANSSNVARGRLLNTSKPSVFGSTCIIMATYRVVVQTGYGSSVNVGGGAFTIRDFNTGVSGSLRFSNRNAIVYSSPGLCPGSVAATNAIGGDFNGTFGAPTTGAPLARNRGTSSNVLGYSYRIFQTGAGPNDYYYGITNNTSATYTTSNTWAKPDSRRVFNLWDIIGDHTGATNQNRGNNPCDTTLPVSASNPCGYMLVINSAYKTDTAFQYTVSNLCPNTYYEISAWFRNICYKCGCDSNGTASTASGYIPFATNDSSGVPPNVAFDINGVDYYTTGNISYYGVGTTTQQGSDTVNRWVKRGFTYVTGPAQTSLTLTIRNNAPGGGGNDWALDDISLATCLPDMAYSPSLAPTVCDSNSIVIYDTVRSYFNNYNYFKWQRSTNGGASWTDVSAATGPITPVWNGSRWEYITSYTVPNMHTTLANNGDRYRLITATTMSNLTDGNCQFTDGVSLISLNIIDCGIALSTDLLSFNGQLSGNNPVLSWTTSKEDEPLIYDVERSFDGITFVTAGSINGHNDPAQELNEYSFRDGINVSGKVWYRLMIRNSNNKRKYSRIITFSKDDDFTLVNLVNPFNNKLTFDLSIGQDSRIDVHLMDMSGKTLRTKTFAAKAGVNNLAIENTNSLPAGIYILQIKKDDKVITRKVVK